MVKGEGQYLFDELGNRYLDCINNVAHVGHGNKRVLEAVSKQLSLLNTNSRFLHDNLSLYASKLTATFPKELSVCFLVNSGSEANDLAIRLARAHTKRKDIISVDGAYHGNLTSTMAISPYKLDKLNEIDYKPAKWAHKALLPCQYRGLFTKDVYKGTNADTIGRLYALSVKDLIDQVQAKSEGKKPREVAAMIVESMVSCGGQTPLPTGYLRHLQQYLHANKSLLICDEVQTGFGRSGKKMWAFQLDGDDIKPDIVTVGKPMGNGFPCSAVITTPEIANSFKNIGTEYFNTFGGNPVSCAAALAVLEEINELNLIKQADSIGTYILDELDRICANSEIVGDIRGVGYFIGIDLVKNKTNKLVAPDYAQFLVEKFRQERILMNTEGKYGNVLKFKPPMVFNMDNAIEFLSVFEKSLNELELSLSLDKNMTGPDLVGDKSSSSSLSSSSSVSSSSWLESSCEL